MGAELVDQSAQEAPGDNAAEQSFAETFRRALPYYMAMGMSPKDFWDRDCELAKYYREAHEIKQEQRNHELWLQGLYVHEAVGVAIVNAFSKKKAKYLDKPLPATKREISALDAEAKSGSAKNAKYNRMLDRMKRVAAGVNAHFKKVGASDSAENGKEADKDV